MSLAPPEMTAPPARMKRRAKAQFDAWAGHYDRSLLNFFLFQPSYITLMEEIARWHAEHPRPFSLLDVGCGTGTLVGLLAGSPWSIDVVGIDYAVNMCAAAKLKSVDNHHRIRFVNADSDCLPFPDGVFDIITCSNSFHHYPHQQAVVIELARLLSRDGRLIIIDGFRDCALGWFIYDIVVARLEGGVHHAPWTTMHRYFQVAGLRNMRRRKFNFLFPAFATVADR